MTRLLVPHTKDRPGVIRCQLRGRQSEFFSTPRLGLPVSRRVAHLMVQGPGHCAPARIGREGHSGRKLEPCTEHPPASVSCTASAQPGLRRPTAIDAGFRGPHRPNPPSVIERPGAGGIHSPVRVVGPMMLPKGAQCCGGRYLRGPGLARTLSAQLRTEQTTPHDICWPRDRTVSACL